MIDISAVGSKIVIKKHGGGTPFEITQFSDEGTPFEAGDVDLSTNAKSLNGQMISSRTPSVYPVSLTVIPGSDDDGFLLDILQKSSIMPGGVKAISDIVIDSLELIIPSINKSNGNNSNGTSASETITYTWVNGRMKSGPTGPSTSAEGRLSARTYTFEFEKFSCESGYFDVQDAYNESANR